MFRHDNSGITMPWRVNANHTTSTLYRPGANMSPGPSEIKSSRVLEQRAPVTALPENFSTSATTREALCFARYKVSSDDQAHQLHSASISARPKPMSNCLFGSSTPAGIV